MRSHQAPGTVSRCILTALDRAHGVGIVVGSTGLCFQPVCVRGVAPRGFWRDSGFSGRFPGRDGGLGGRRAGLRRAAGRGAAGRDPVPRSGALAGWLASIDAVDSVDLVRERRPARGRAKSSCCAPGGWVARCALASSRYQVGNVGLMWQMDGAEPRGVGATRFVLVGVFVCSVASSRRVYILNTY